LLVRAGESRGVLNDEVRGSDFIEFGDQCECSADVLRSLAMRRDNLAVLRPERDAGRDDQSSDQSLVENIDGADHDRRSLARFQLADRHLGLDLGTAKRAAQALAGRQAEKGEVAVADQAIGDVGALGRHKLELRWSRWADEEYRAPDAASIRKFKHFRDDTEA